MEVFSVTGWPLGSTGRLSSVAGRHQAMMRRGAGEKGGWGEGVASGGGGEEGR